MADGLTCCFEGLPNEELALLNHKKTQVAFLKGETIFKQGAFAPHILFVNQGLVLTYLHLQNGKRINIHLSKQSDYLAFSVVFDKSIYEYSSVAITDSTLCMIEKEALRDVIMRNPEFAMKITSRNSKKESRYLDIIKNLSYKQMRGKLASAILYLSTETYLEESVFQYLTRQDIADFASITVESTVKFLKEFEKDKLIELDGRHVIIKDIDRLRELDLIG